MKIFVSAILISIVAFAACNPEVNHAVNPGVSVPQTTRAECEANCGSLGMRLGSVVLIMSSAGCVCVPNDAPPSADNGGEAATAGGAQIAAAAAAEAAASAAAQAALLQQQHQRQQQQQSHH
ncbi:MAG TPA: hypothetical protein VL463_07740 [Kofleriaceae bacterium]|nr:hypothetical protein [Kofleriaceae bacterium]